MPAKPTHVLDASAVIAYLKGEPGHEVLADLLTDPGTHLAIHIINACEVYYNYLGADGLAVAERAWEITAAVATIIEMTDVQFAKRVGRWKVDHGLGLGDSIAAATAEQYSCPLVTTDHRDFDPIGAAGALPILWLRPGGGLPLAGGP